MSQEIYRVLVVDNDDTSRAESCAFLKGWQLYDGIVLLIVNQ